jgi:hypothetical protein
MTNFNAVFPVLMLISGIFLMLWTTRFNRNILNGQETSLRKYFVRSALYGLWVFLISVGGILAAGSVYEGYNWTTRETIGIALLGVIGGILAMIGSLWQFFIVTKFRDSLYQRLSRKNKKK